MTWQILEGDCRERLAELHNQSVQTCVTSPPYFGLRDYGHDGQLGLEPTPDEFAQALVEVFRDVRRVLKDDGTVWLNLGDSYAGSGRGIGDTKTDNRVNLASRHFHEATVNQGAIGRAWVAPPAGLKNKDLIGIPWMVAFALRADGWYLRQDIIWHKPNPMPESVTDRCTKAHEYIFLLTKSRRYYFDAEAIAEEATYGGTTARTQRATASQKSAPTTMKNGIRPASERKGGTSRDTDKTRNKRDVWTVNVHAYRGAHFATFPPALIEPCILAGSKEGDTVLDPFSGSGTTGMVALRHGRSYIGCELNPKYAEMSRQRIIGDAPLLNQPSEVAA